MDPSGTLVKMVDLFSERCFNALNKIHRILKGTKYIEIQLEKYLKNLCHTNICFFTKALNIKIWFWV